MTKPEKAKPMGDNILHEAKRLRLLAAALELQHFTRTAANVVPIPGGDQVIAIGTPAQVAVLLQIGPVPDELIRLGAQMASTLYNLKQQGDIPLRAYDREKLGELQEQWDAARRAYREAAQQQLVDQAQAMGGYDAPSVAVSSDGKYQFEWERQGATISVSNVRAIATDTAAMKMTLPPLAGATDSEGGHHD